jgi:hypothetical protein
MIASLLARGVAATGNGLPVSATVNPALGAARPGPAAVRSMFRGDYEPPKNSEHDGLYEDLKAKQILEKLSGALTAIRLKKPLWMKFAGCVSNAWYQGGAQGALGEAGPRPPRWAACNAEMSWSSKREMIRCAESCRTHS